MRSVLLLVVLTIAADGENAESSDDHVDCSCVD